MISVRQNTFHSPWMVQTSKDCYAFLVFMLILARTALLFNPNFPLTVIFRPHLMFFRSHPHLNTGFPDTFTQKQSEIMHHFHFFERKKPRMVSHTRSFKQFLIRSNLSTNLSQISLKSPKTLVK